jgi:hypothetical protein
MLSSYTVLPARWGGRGRGQLGTASVCYKDRNRDRDRDGEGGVEEDQCVFVL